MNTYPVDPDEDDKNKEFFFVDAVSNITDNVMFNGIQDDFCRSDAGWEPTIFYHDSGLKIRGFNNLERLCKLVEQTNLPAVKIHKRRNGSIEYEVTSIGKLIPHLAEFTHAYAPSLLLSERLECLREALANSNLISLDGFVQPDFIIGRFDSTAYSEEKNKFIAELRVALKSRKIRRKISDRARSADRNYQSCRKYIDNLFKAYGKLCVIRIDLSYGFPEREHFPPINIHMDSRPSSPYELNAAELIRMQIEGARKDMIKLLNNVRSNSIFTDMVGYIWKLEFGFRKGFHYHMLFFFDGKKVRSDVSKAKKIGEYWKKMVAKTTTHGGRYYNCNAAKNQYRQIGIGIVTEKNWRKREALLLALQYLTKKDQYLVIRSNACTRSIGRGVIKEVEATPKKRRAPRRPLYKFLDADTPMAALRRHAEAEAQKALEEPS
jgi:hypothetical protein